MEAAAGVRLDAAKERQRILKDFLEGFVHSVCFLRNIYPKESFERTQRFSAPIHKSRSALLAEYIRSVVEDVDPFILSETLERFGVEIVHAEGKSLERFVVETRFGQIDSSTSISLIELDEHLRACYLRLYTSASLLPDLQPKEKSFRVLVKTADSPGTDWVLSDTDASKEENEDEKKGRKVVPLRAFKSNVLQLQVFVEF